MGSGSRMMITIDKIFINFIIKLLPIIKSIFEVTQAKITPGIHGAGMLKPTFRQFNCNYM